MKLGIMDMISHCIEGNPVIIRFKTEWIFTEIRDFLYCIEGNPVIIRFKTVFSNFFTIMIQFISIEGNPVIIRFKTFYHGIFL